jgi:fructooligosaccharide transport system permease protein
MTVGRRDKLVAGLFVAPAVLLIGLFVFLPLVHMVRISLHRQALTAPELGPDCAWENYHAVLADPDFRLAAKNTARFALWVVPVQSVAALALAIWVNGPGWSRRGLRVAVFLPTVLSLTVTSVVWRLLLEPAHAGGGGMFNGLLTLLHLPAQPFLTSPRQAMACIIVMSIWQGVGFQMMIFLAGLQTIPEAHHEAATLDGAGRWRRFVHVTLPGITPTAVVVVTLTSIFALKLFVQPYLMTRGGPMGSTQTLVQYMFRAAFTRRDLGIACAAGVLFLIAVGAVTLVQRWAGRRWEEVA